VAVIADADTWVPYAQLDKAVRFAWRTGKLVSALSSVVEFGQEDVTTVQSSMTVVARMLWGAPICLAS
jgi:hypothetical protein